MQKLFERWTSLSKSPSIEVGKIDFIIAYKCTLECIINKIKVVLACHPVTIAKSISALTSLVGTVLNDSPWLPTTSQNCSDRHLPPSESVVNVDFREDFVITVPKLPIECLGAGVTTLGNFVDGSKTQ